MGYMEAYMPKSGAYTVSKITKKLSCRREATRCFTPLDTVLSLEVIRNYTVE